MRRILSENINRNIIGSQVKTQLSSLVIAETLTISEQLHSLLVRALQEINETEIEMNVFHNQKYGLLQVVPERASKAQKWFKSAYQTANL